jgi:DNA-binding response OmpR family regulator
MELGSNAFIEKPFELKDLVKTIETVLTPADGETMSMAS